MQVDYCTVCNGDAGGSSVREVDHFVSFFLQALRSHARQGVGLILTQELRKRYSGIYVSRIDVRKKYSVGANDRFDWRFCG